MATTKLKRKKSFLYITEKKEEHMGVQQSLELMGCNSKLAWLGGVVSVFLIILAGMTYRHVKEGTPKIGSDYQKTEEAFAGIGLGAAVAGVIGSIIMTYNREKYKEALPVEMIFDCRRFLIVILFISIWIMVQAAMTLNLVANDPSDSSFLDACERISIASLVMSSISIFAYVLFFLSDFFRVSEKTNKEYLQVQEQVPVQQQQIPWIEQGFAPPPFPGMWGYQ